MVQPSPARAAIDLGTQSALLLIGVADPSGPIEVLEDHCASARLGTGAAPDGRLDPGSVERTLEVLATFLRRTDARGIAPGQVRAAATAVLRRAPDRERFLERVRRELGFEFRVLSGEQEAEIGFRGVFGDASVGAGSPSPARFLLDLGGGSTELAWDWGRQAISVPYGAVVATERTLGRAAEGPLEAALLAALETAARQAAEGFPADLVPEGADLVLIGGSAGNLACLVLGLESFDHRVAEGQRVSAADAWLWARRLAALDLEARRDLPIEPDRAAILPAALAGIGAVLERVGAPAARVSGRGLRHGLLLA